MQCIRTMHEHVAVKGKKLLMASNSTHFSYDISATRRWFESDDFLMQPVVPIGTFSCECPEGFAGISWPTKCACTFHLQIMASKDAQSASISAIRRPVVMVPRVYHRRVPTRVNVLMDGLVSRCSKEMLVTVFVRMHFYCPWEARMLTHTHFVALRPSTLPVTMIRARTT